MKKIKIVIMTIICLSIIGVIGVNAANMIASNQVSYDNKNSESTATTVQDALDELYEKTENLQSDEIILFDSGVEGNFELDYTNYLGAPTGGYNKITASKETTSVLINLNNGNCAGGFGTNEKIDLTNYSKLAGIVQVGTSIQKLELDLTDITGEYYVGFSAHNASGSISGALSLWQTSKTQGWPTERAGTTSISMMVGSTVVTDFYKINVIKLWLEK